MTDYSIEPVVRRARRQFPHLADDLEQEIRLGHWLSAQKGDKPGTSRIRGKQRGIDFVRKFQGQSEKPGRFYRGETVPFLDDPFDGGES